MRRISIVAFGLLTHFAFGADACPVDLNGNYFFGGDGTTLSASTAGANAVVEPAGVAEGTCTPFSDAIKPPIPMAVSLTNKGFQFDIEAIGTWAQEVSPGDGDRLTCGSLAGSASVIVDRNPLGYRFTDPDNGVSFYLDVTQASKFRIKVTVGPTGLKTLRVTTVDGLAPGTFATSSSNVSGGSGAVAGFRVSLHTGFGRKGTGQVRVTGFECDAPGNSMFLAADDPYVKPGETITYRLGMANLSQPVGGFQAFLAKSGNPTLQTYVTGTYTPTPFPSARFWGDPIPASLYLGGGIPLGGTLVSANAKLADLFFTAVSADSVGLSVRPNNGSGFDTQFSDDLGTAFLPVRQDSNKVVIDGTIPTVTGFDGIQNSASVLSVGMVPGPLTVKAVVTDALSGLAGRPVMTIDYAPIGTGPEDVVLTAYSSSAPNEFRAETTVTPAQLSGPGRLKISTIDDSGNTNNVTSSTFAVAKTFSGIVTLETFIGDPTLWPVTIEIREVGSTTAITSQVVSLDGLGHFTFNQAIAPGTYDFAAKAAHWLRKVRGSVTINSSGATGVNFSLLNADCNDDNSVDIGDYAVLSAAYLSFDGDPNWNPMADVNGDETVDIGDYAILSQNYLLFGDD